MSNLPGYVIAEKDQEIRNTIKESLTKGASEYLTICEQFRFIYDDIYTLPDGELKNRLIEKLIDGFNMGKKMNARLAHYKRLHDDNSGSRGAHLIKLENTSERERIRNER